MNAGGDMHGRHKAKWQLGLVAARLEARRSHNGVLRPRTASDTYLGRCACAAECSRTVRGKARLPAGLEAVPLNKAQPTVTTPLPIRAKSFDARHSAAAHSKLRSRPTWLTAADSTARWPRCGEQGSAPPRKWDGSGSARRWPRILPQIVAGTRSVPD